MDRYDGKVVKDVSDIQVLMPHLMLNRADAEVYFQEKLDVTNLEVFCKENNINLFSAMICALAKMFTLRPKFNRFIQGQKIYQKNDITMSFVCKTKFDDDAPESLITIKVEPMDDLNSISQRIGIEIMKKRNGEVSESDYSAARLSKMPYIFRVLLFKILHILDYYGVNLSKLTSTDPSYSSCLVSNLGSIDLPVMYHHLNNYGTNSCVVTLGKIHKEEIIEKDGTRRICDIMEIGATVDERIADGFYFSNSVKILNEVVRNPKLLLKPLSEKVF